MSKISASRIFPEHDKFRWAAHAVQAAVAVTLVAVKHLTSISVITGTQSGKPPQMPHNRPIPFSGADYLLLTKETPGPVCDRILYRHESPLSLSLLQRSPPGNAPDRHATREGINESQPKRENLLEFNNFCMVNVIEQSQWSQWYQSLRGSRVLPSSGIIVGRD